MPGRWRSVRMHGDNHAMKTKPTKADLFEVTERDEFVLFWGGWPSQWYPAGEERPLPAAFIVRGVHYTHAEQYMMAAKAELFGDKKTHAKIMKCSDPMGHKELGRAVTPFRAKEWDAVAPGVVILGNLAKFSQNKALRKRLLHTLEKTIVECSPEDTIWGIGMYASDPRATMPSEWNGENKLGAALMAVRSMLRIHTDREISIALGNR